MVQRLLLLYACACSIAVVEGEPPCTSGTCPAGGLPDSRFAFVTLAIDRGDYRGSGAIWQVIPIARALQRFHSPHPFLVLSNVEKLPDGADVKTTLAKLGVQVLTAEDVPIPEHVRRSFRYAYWETAWQKLQIWKLTQFERIIWMDSDAMLMRSIDHLFTEAPPFMMRNTWMCQMESPKLNSGLMLVEPSEATFQGILAYAESLTALPDADQQLILGYYENVAQQKVRHFDVLDAAFGHCIGMVPGINNTDISSKWGFESPWRLPAFVHKSSSGNDCFSFDMSRQHRLHNGRNVNICHYNPVAAHWRDVFCDAVRIIGSTTPKIQDYCDDGRWYAAAK